MSDVIIAIVYLALLLMNLHWRKFLMLNDYYTNDWMFIYSEKKEPKNLNVHLVGNKANTKSFYFKSI